MIEWILLALPGLFFAAYNPKITWEMVVGEKLGLVFILCGSAAVYYYWGDGNLIFPRECVDFVAGYGGIQANYKYYALYQNPHRSCKSSCLKGIDIVHPVDKHGPRHSPPESVQKVPRTSYQPLPHGPIHRGCPCVDQHRRRRRKASVPAPSRARLSGSGTTSN